MFLTPSVHVLKGNHRKPSLIGKLPGATLQGSSTRVQDEALWPKLAPRGCASTDTWSFMPRSGPKNYSLRKGLYYLWEGE